MTNSSDSLSPDSDSLSSVRFGGFWIRVGATLVDALITIPVFVGMLFVGSPLIFLIGILALLAYKPFFEGVFGATPGKMALGLLVVDKELVKVGPVSALIRAAIFILANIPNYFSYYKMKVAGIGFTDVEAVQEFQAANQNLQIIGWVFGLVVMVACIWVAFNARKRGLHDMIADTFVVYKESLPRR